MLKEREEFCERFVSVVKGKDEIKTDEDYKLLAIGMNAVMQVSPFLSEIRMKYNDFLEENADFTKEPFTKDTADQTNTVIDEIEAFSKETVTRAAKEIVRYRDAREKANLKAVTEKDISIFAEKNPYLFVDIFTMFVIFFGEKLSEIAFNSVKGCHVLVVDAGDPIDMGNGRKEINVSYEVGTLQEDPIIP